MAAAPYAKIFEGNGASEITRKYIQGRLAESRDGEGRITAYVYSGGGTECRNDLSSPRASVTTLRATARAGWIAEEKDGLRNVQTWAYPDGSAHKVRGWPSRFSPADNLMGGRPSLHDDCLRSVTMPAKWAHR